MEIKILWTQIIDPTKQRKILEMVKGFLLKYIGA
jgi:hypothetical protein